MESTGEFKKLTTHFFSALKSGDLRLMKSLVKKTPMLLQTNNGIFNAFTFASIHSNDALRYLFRLYKKYGKKNIYEYPFENLNIYGFRLIHMLVVSNNKDGLEIALNNGVEINSKDFEGNTALNMAVMYSNPEIIQILLRYGANPRIGNLFNVTPLKRSIAIPRPDIFAILIKTNAFMDLNQKQIQQIYKLKNSELTTMLQKEIKIQIAREKYQKRKMKQLKRIKKKDMYLVFLCQNLEDNTTLSELRKMAENYNIFYTPDTPKSQLCQLISQKLILSRKLLGI
jgi:hypothetical protein